MVQISYSKTRLSSTQSPYPTVAGYSARTVLAGEEGFAASSIGNTTADALRSSVFKLTLPKGLASETVTTANGSCGRARAGVVSCRLGTLDAGSLTTVNLESNELLVGAPASYDTRCAVHA